VVLFVAIDIDTSGCIMNQLNKERDAIMEEIVKLLDKNLECVRYEVKDDRIVIWVKSSKKGAVYPYCETPSTRDR